MCNINNSKARKKRWPMAIAAGLLGAAVLVIGDGSYRGWGHDGWAANHGAGWAGDPPHSERNTLPPRGMPACRATLSLTGGYVKSPDCNN
jgi:hypothetical protein